MKRICAQVSKITFLLADPAIVNISDFFNWGVPEDWVLANFTGDGRRIRWTFWHFSPRH
jgi:hypothetical protein